MTNILNKKKERFGDRHAHRENIMWDEGKDWVDASRSQETPAIASKPAEAKQVRELILCQNPQKEAAPPALWFGAEI